VFSGVPVNVAVYVDVAGTFVRVADGVNVIVRELVTVIIWVPVNVAVTVIVPVPVNVVV